MILRDFFLYRELKKNAAGRCGKGEDAGKRIGLWLTIGLVIVVFGIVNFGMRKNAEGLRILLFIFLGIYLAEKFGFGLFLKVRKHKKSYYAKLIPYNSFYYRFKSTFRYVYVISLMPVLILFLFGKDMISAKIAQKPEGLFPYDFVCMATEADATFWKQLQEKYDVKFQEYPMVRVTNVDNSEKLDDARAVIMPQGQHIGISETTYKELNKALGKKKCKK